MTASIEVHPTAIDGLLLIDLPVHGDNRGWFKENWQREKLLDAGVPDLGPVQNNISFNVEPGVTRGIHAEPWDKYISVAHGKVFGAWVDLRAGDGFGRVVTAEITPDKAVYVPRGVGNAFQTLEADTVYTYLVNEHWSPEARAEYTFVNLADPTLAIDWPIELSNAEMSDADRAHPQLADVKPMGERPLLIIGSGGQLGRALVEACEDRGIAFRAVDREQWDMTDPNGWADELLRSSRAVINAAAYTAVDAAETDEGRQAAWAVNATGASVLAARCDAARVPLVHVSTDYVFDGRLAPDLKYVPDSPRAPLGVYGQSKAAGEVAVAAVPRHWIVRTSWLIGDGPNFVRTMMSLAERGVDPAVITDQRGRLSFASELAEGILHLISTGAPFGTYQLTGAGEPCSWFDIAQEVFRLVGADPNRVTPVTTEEYGRGRDSMAPRPHNSVMCLGATKSAGFQPRDHMESLAAYVQQQGAGR